MSERIYTTKDDQTVDLKCVSAICLDSEVIIVLYLHGGSTIAVLPEFCGSSDLDRAAAKELFDEIRSKWIKVIEGGE